MKDEWRKLVEERGVDLVTEVIASYEPEVNASYWEWAAQQYKDLAWRNLPYPGCAYRYNLPGLPEVMDIASQASQAASEADRLYYLTGAAYLPGYTTILADLFASPAMIGLPVPTWSDPGQTCAILRALALYAAQCAALIEDRVRTLRAQVEVRQNKPGWEQGELIPQGRG